MKSNQSLHISVKQPPNPNPVRSIAVFDDLSNPTLPAMIQTLLSGIPNVPKDEEFKQNVREEALQALLKGTVCSVTRMDGHLVIVLKEGTK